MDDRFKRDLVNSPILESLSAKLKAEGAEIEEIKAVPTMEELTSQRDQMRVQMRRAFESVHSKDQ